MILSSTPFRFERQMLAPLAAGLPRLLALPAENYARVLREPTLGMIIPDLLVGSWAPAAPPLAYAGATLLDAHVRALVEREGPLAKTEIVRRLHLSATAGQAAIARLLRHGVLIRVSADVETGEEKENDPVISLAPSAASCRLEIIALETKLTRWTDAVEQAASYLTFADRALVVLDGNQVTESPALLHAVEAAHVGLVFQYGRALTTLINAPLHSAPQTPARMMALTKLVTDRGGRAFRTFAPERAAAAIACCALS